MDRLKTLQTFLAEDPGDSFLRFAIASEYIKTGNDAEGISWLMDLLEDDPAYIGAYYHLGKALAREGRSVDAENVFRDGIQVAASQSDFQARSELQSALLELDDADPE